MKKVLVIDDSALMRRVMSDIISSTKEYMVAYTASNGVEGLDIIQKNNDIFAAFCDINMPKMGGIDLLKTVKKLNINIPFIMISSKQETNDTMLALELGCLDFIKKPENIFKGKDEVFNSQLLIALKLAEEVDEKAHKDLEAKKKAERQPSYLLKKKAAEPARSEARKNTPIKTGKGNKLVALVCSTGGPKALQRVIPKLPKNLPAPVVLVQHMPAGFTATMAQRLNSLSAIKVKEAEDGEKIENGVVYVAKGGLHMKVEDGKISFDDAPPVVGLKPCGNIMYKSLVGSKYDEIICVVLTGMGSDGTKGIKELGKTNNIYVIAQDEESSTVYGMPKAVYDCGLTDCVCDLDEIANQITKKVGA